MRFAKPDGDELEMSSFRGKPLVINFWATWCAPCVKEMPQLEEFHKAYATKGWNVVGLAIDSPTPVREFLTKVPVTFPIGLAGMDGTQLSRTLGNDQGALPFSVILDSTGMVRHTKLGDTNFEELVGWAQETRA
jgi:thiol-disulfide isomerase/thioredoxin